MKWILPLFSLLVLSLYFSFGGASSTSKKVLFLSFDGFSHDFLQKYLKTEFKNKGLGRIEKEGFIATQGLEVTLPSLTATSHISLITGVAPQKHGVVSNTFHKSSDPIQRSTSGFDALLDSGALPLWEQLKAQGKTVGIMSYPAADGKNDKRKGHWGMYYSQSESPSETVTYSKNDFRTTPHIAPEDIPSYSRSLVATIYLNEKRPTDNSPDAEGVKHAFQMLAMDTTDDSTTNYDKLIFDTDLDFSQDILGVVDARRNTWAGLSFKTEQGILKGSWCKLLFLAPDLSSVQLYVSPLYGTRAYPVAFQTLLYERAGFWPGSPDKGTKDEQIFLEQSIRFSNYLKEATIASAKEQNWDVMIGYQPLLDELEHQFYMTDPKQTGYSPEKSRYFLELIRQGYLQVNQVIEELMKALPDTNIIIVSDHGMEPIHSVYYPNRVLKNHGYLGKNLILARTFSSGGFSHIYINLKNREPEGVVSQKQFSKIKQELKELFKKELPIADVYFREELDPFGLNHPNSGDVVIVAKPGYHLNDDFSKDEFIEASSFYGQHGYDPKLSSMKGIFAAWGPDIQPQKMRSSADESGAFSYKDILPFVLKLLQ